MQNICYNQTVASLKLNLFRIENMKFKKFLGAVCSFLLATTSLLCGGPASAKNWSGENVCVFMVNSGEELGNGKRDGDERDKAYWDTQTMSSIRTDGSRFNSNNGTFCKYLMLNLFCPTAVEAIKNMTIFAVPDVFVVVANLAKSDAEVQKDINKQLDQISECQKNSVLYRGCAFESSETLCGKEVYLDTVPVVMYGVVPEGMTQTTSNDKFVKIAKQTKRERQGNGVKDGKFKYIHNKVYVLQSDGTYTGINMDNASEIRGVDFYQAIKTIAETDSLKPTLWENYHDKELPLRKAEEAKRKAAEEEEERRKAQAKRKNKKIVGGTLVGLGGALAIGSAIFGGVKHNQNKKSKGNKTKVPQAQKMQISAIS